MQPLVTSMSSSTLWGHEMQWSSRGIAGLARGIVEVSGISRRALHASSPKGDCRTSGSHGVRGISRMEPRSGSVA